MMMVIAMVMVMVMMMVIAYFKTVGCRVTHNGAGARTDSDDDQLSGDLDDAFDVDDSVLPKQ